MTPFQYITLPLVAFLFMRNLWRLRKGVRRRGSIILTSAVWLAAGAAIWKPDITMQVAELLGIGRGADLVLYFLTIAFILVSLYFYNKYKNIESSITKIVRQHAIYTAIENRANEVGNSDKAPEDNQKEGS